METQKSDADIEIRALSTHDEFRACVAMQREIWGEGFGEVVPASILMVAQKVGGVCAGAFDRNGEMVGFVFGISGVRAGRFVHWSDILGVRNTHRNRGIGYRLKLFQREYLLQQGVETVYWSYDPLEARNANLNLNKLGAVICEYVKDMYASEDSDLHRGLGMDRFIVAWHLRDPRVRKLVAGEEPAPVFAPGNAPIVNSERSAAGEPLPAERDLPAAARVLVEIPADIQRTKQSSPELGARWRSCTRRAFLHYLGQGYRVHAFRREAKSGRWFYLLTAE